MNDRNNACIFGALKNADRRRIIAVLSEHERCVGEICRQLKLSQPQTSHHLRILAKAGLVQMHKHGATHVFSLRSMRAASAIKYLTSDKGDNLLNGNGVNGRELIYIWDIGTGSMKWQGDVDLALGFKKGEFPRNVGGWEDRLHPADRRRVIKAAARHLSHGVAFRQQYRIRKKQGRYCVWQDCGAAMFDDEGRPYKWVGMVRAVED